MQGWSPALFPYQKIESVSIVICRLFMPSLKLADNAQDVVYFYGGAALLPGLSQFQRSKQVQLSFIELPSPAGFHADPFKFSNKIPYAHMYATS
jgi:hypothetical protein